MEARGIVSFLFKMAQSYFTVTEPYAGKSLRDIASDVAKSGGYVPRLDVISEVSGLGEGNPLTSGQSIAFKNDPGAGEYKFLQSLFGNPSGAPTTAPGGNQTYQQQAQGAIQPAVDTLKSGIDPLKQRYNDLISSIKSRGQQSEQQAGINAAQEFAKRGIPLSSGAYGDFLASRINPIRTETSALEADTGLKAQNAEQSIMNAIASLQGQAGFTGLEQALAYAQLAQNQNQFEDTQSLLRDKFGFEKELANKKSPASLADQYMSLGEGSTLINLLTGKPLYTAPKTYKSTGGGGGGGGSDPLGIFG